MAQAEHIETLIEASAAIARGLMDPETSDQSLDDSYKSRRAAMDALRSEGVSGERIADIAELAFQSAGFAGINRSPKSKYCP